MSNYTDWYRDEGADRVVLAIAERGDKSAANTLCLSTTPYHDRNTNGGDAWETTYRPFYAGIMSAVIIDESSSGVTVSELDVFNDGRFDSILTDANMIGHKMDIYFGNPTWDALSNFMLQARCRITDVVFKNESIFTIKLSPRGPDLKTKIGTETQPVGYGRCNNVKAILIDSATNIYRVNSVWTHDSFDANSVVSFFLRMNGVLLVEGTHYDLVLDGGGDFNGDIEMLTAVTGELTADINFDTVFAKGIRNALNNVLSDIPDDAPYGTTQPLFASGSHEAGVWVNKPTEIGQLCKDIFGSVFQDFYINNQGYVIGFQLKIPSNIVSIEINESDILRDGVSGIRHIKSLPPVKNFTIRYDKNFTVQSAASLADSLNDDDRLLYSSEYKELTDSNVLADFPITEELIVDTLLTDLTEVTAEMARLKILRGQVRRYFEIDLKFSSGLVGMARTVRINANFPAFAYGSLFYVVGIRRNLSQEKVTITVFI
jgi:hypothetical protein